MATNTLLWLRNDLRIDDNPALTYAISKNSAKALFFISEKQWKKHNVAAIKVDFILRHVALLRQQLASKGIELDIVEVDDFSAQIDFLQGYCLRHGVSEVVANEELEINERQRDERFASSAMAVTLFEADVIVPKGALLNKQGEMYKVFTPFRKAWLAYVQQHSVQISNGLVTCTLQPLGVDETNIEPIVSNCYRKDSMAWPLVTDVKQQVLPQFLHSKVADYQHYRDIPSIKATSGLSPYLAIGAISPKVLLRSLLADDPELLSHQSGGRFTWLNELVWREFYRHLLHHYPRLAKGENFNSKYNNLPWMHNEQRLRAWQQGKTGYPLVDAAMRQLLKTGWMHNRLRMVVASFLSKHLLLDWRYGEKFFSEHLIDGDLAANNGGWQWAAGTGCDAQPYFRIFNPISQSEKFDPEAKFIRKYLPELDEVPDKYIHFPHDYIEQQGLHCYWPAIVDHKQARLQALEFYKQAN